MKKTTLFLLLASCGTLFSNAQTGNFSWEEQHIDTAGNSQYGVLELVGKDQHSLWGLLYKSGQLLNANRYFIRSSDGGTHWKKIASPYPNMFVNGLAAVDSLTAYYVMSDWNMGRANNRVIKTVDGGAHWNQVLTPDSSIIPTHVYFFNANEGIVVCDPMDGYWTIYRTSNAGQNWTRVKNDSIHSAPLAGEFGGTFIFDAEGDKYWFLTGKGFGNPSRVFYTPNKGASWYAGDTLNTNVLIQTAALAFRDGEHGLVRCNDQLFKTDNHGMNWTPVSTSGTMFTYDMCHVPGTNMYISTGGDTSSQGHSLHGIGTSYTEDDGATWHVIDTAVHHSAILFTSTREGWTGSINRSNGTGGAYRALFPSTGITEAFIKSGLSLTTYPNPASDEITVQLSGVRNGFDMPYSIISIAGQTMRTGTVSNGETISLSALTQGMYFLIVNGTQTKIIKK